MTEVRNVILRKFRTPAQIFLLLVCSSTLLLVSSCKDLTDVIEVPGFSVPSLGVPTFTPTTLDTHTLPGGTGDPTDNVLVTIAIQVKAFDSVGISGVTASVSSPGWTQTNEPSTTLVNLSLNDDGASPDSKAHDSIYSGTATFEIFRYQVGTYNIQVKAVNTLGTPVTRIASVTLTNSANHAPHIDATKATKDTLTLGTVTVVDTLTAKISDVESLRDILSVTTRATKPDGTLAGVTVSLYDDGDGAHADAAKGDGIYSAGIVLDPNAVPPPQKGTYVFKFIATDKSGATATDSTKITVQ
jgi:hypothetical protein